MRLSVLHLTTCYPRFRGDFAGVFVQRLVRALAGAGVEATVLAPGDDTGAAAREEAPEGVIHRFRYAPRRLQTLAYGYGGIPAHLRDHPARALLAPSFLASFAARALRLSRGATLVHANWLYTGLAALPAARFGGLPLVLTLRGSDMLAASRRGAAMRLLARLVLDRADRVIAVSEDMRARAIALGVDGARIETIANGVELAETPSREEARGVLGLPLDGRVILTVGNVVPAKGIADLLAAATEVCRARPDTLFALAGGGEAIASFAETAGRLGIADRVRFLGFRPTHEIPSWLAAADLFVLPSLSEGRPNSLLEAMAAGVPVVATRVGGVGEVVRDGESGLLVPPCEPARLAAAILDLLGDPDRASRLAEGGRRAIREAGLTWEACATRTLAVYERVLSSRGSSG